MASFERRDYDTGEAAFELWDNWGSGISLSPEQAKDLLEWLEQQRNELDKLVQQNDEDVLAHLNHEEVTAKIKELHRLIGIHYGEIAKLERVLHRYEDEQLARAPRGTYRHRRADGSDIEVEAAVLETEGDAKYIHYQIPKWQARRGEEDAYMRWLRSPDEVARFTPAK